MALKLAVIGATGLVGQQLLSIIDMEAEPGSLELGLYASAGSSGTRLAALGREHTVASLEECSFSSYDAAFFCVGDELSQEYVPKALEAGCVVVDKSNTYRLQPDVPLVVPGVNDGAVDASTRLVANPNCTTIVLCHALAPLHKRFGIRRLYAATYQSITGAGKQAALELVEDARRLLGSEEDLYRAVEPGQLAFNVQPQIGRLNGHGQASEEAKLINESRKILSAPQMQVACHAVRVPVLVGHGIAATVELVKPASRSAVQAAFAESANLHVLEDGLPTPASCARHDKVEAGRLREEPGLENGWSLFVCGDNLRIGAALNGWRILHLLQRAGAV